MLSPSLRYNPFNGIEWSFQMKDLGFDEFGEPVNYGAHDEESKGLAKNIEMSNVEQQAKRDLEAEEEAENTEIAI
jgi:hypothetical protein